MHEDSGSFSILSNSPFGALGVNETPSDINLSGNCGAGTVRLVSDNGNKGTFTSNVKCD